MIRRWLGQDVQTALGSYAKCALQAAGLTAAVIVVKPSTLVSSKIADTDPLVRRLTRHVLAKQSTGPYLCPLLLY
jgi:hypothetical protein